MSTAEYKKPRNDVKHMFDYYSRTRASYIEAYVGERTTWCRASARNWALFYGKMRRMMKGAL